MRPLIAIARVIQQYFHDLVRIPVNQSFNGALENAIVAEHELRLLFGAGHQVEDCFLGLVNVFSLHPATRRTRAHQDPIDPADCYIFPLLPGLRRPALAPSTVSNIDAFKNQWQLFTHGALSKMRPQDWDNIVVAGGSVLACLLPPPTTSERRINEYFQSSIWASSDIDIFLWGLSPEQAEKKMQDIYEAVCAAAPWKVVCIRRARVISIHTSYPYRPIQIILRLYQSPAEILAGFDVDAACCLYNGKDVWVNPRGMASLIRQTNTIDVTRRSPSYEARLAKYAERGFQIYVPSLDRGRVSASLYDADLRAFPNGLARLLVLEALYRQPAPYTYLRHPKTADSTLSSSNYDGILKWVQIPYGPGWDAQRIQNVIKRKDEHMNSPYNIANEDGVIHRHIFFVGDMKWCLRPICEECNRSGVAESPEAVLDKFDMYIKGPIRFIITDPGRQEIAGSFHPITSGDWEEDTYNYDGRHIHPTFNGSGTRRVRFAMVDSESEIDPCHADAVDVGGLSA